MSGLGHARHLLALLSVVTIRLLIVVPSSVRAQEPPTVSETESDGGSFAGSVSADDALTATVSHEQLVSTSGGETGSAPAVAPVRARVCETHAVPGGPDGRGERAQSQARPLKRLGKFRER